MSTEAGAGTVLAAGLALVLIVLLGATMMLARAAVAASRAATAADLAALAGADAARGLSSGDPCTVAADIAGRHEAVLVACVVQGAQADTVEVEVAVDGGVPWAAATGRARAGPPP
ncbi:Rv3654c family TadE-like protein [Pseudarthrobacter sp. P1]|uniref:Rv3654c family TadE-like protein n=1 Tax=Pseudarthrobacter sp. P1 TaxID=3418418 RepID=UPI003CEB54F0